MQARLGGADGNFKDGCSFFEGEVVLIAEKEDCPAGRRNLIEESEESFIGWFSEIWIEGAELFRQCVVEGLPAVSVLEMREGNPGSDAKRPGSEDGRFAQVRQLAEDLERGFLEDVFGESGAGEAGDVAAQGRIGVAEKLFQRGPVAGLREKDQQSWVGRRGLLCWSLVVHAGERRLGPLKVRFER